MERTTTTGQTKDIIYKDMNIANTSIKQSNHVGCRVLQSQPPGLIDMCSVLCL